MDGVTEYSIHTTPTKTANLPASFTGCHNHGTDLYCIAPDGEEVLAEKEKDAAESQPSDHDHEHGAEQDHDHSGDAGSNVHCHSHAGVEYVSPTPRSPSAIFPSMCAMYETNIWKKTLCWRP